eukprot:gene6234-biopygen8778
MLKGLQPTLRRSRSFYPPSRDVDACVPEDSAPGADAASAAGEASAAGGRASDPCCGSSRGAVITAVTGSPSPLSVIAVTVVAPLSQPRLVRGCDNCRRHRHRRRSVIAAQARAGL